MAQFSRRYNYDPNINHETTYEDAPDWLRIAYINNILDHLTYDDHPNLPPEYQDRPLEISQIYKEICTVLRKDFDEDYWEYTWIRVTGIIKSCEWYKFYDIVEYVGKKLKKEELNYFSDELAAQYGFDTYRTNINKLFADENIGWRLDKNSELKREIPKALYEKIQATDQELAAGLAAAREHYKKAVRYTYDRPLDPENAIKEIISAIESIGKKLYPETSTLGDVIKEMRNSGSIPSLLTSTIEKFYAFASNEPAVRHGSPVESRVSLMDAEFCLHVGIALIRYLLAKEGSPQA